MSDGVLIGIDAGTSVIKSVAFTTAGEQIAAAAIPNAYQTFADGGAEQDMARTWRDAAETLRQLSGKVPDLAKRLVAIAVTGQGDGMWLIDKAGEPVAPAWLWLDARAAAIAEDFVNSADHAAHYRRTGTGVNACQMSIQLAWMTRNRPDVLARATTGFHCKDWLYFKLTGIRATDPSEANFTFGQYVNRRYAPEILDKLGAPDAKAPAAGDRRGHRGRSTGFRPKPPALTGLKAGTPIVLGYVDVVCTGARRRTLRSAGPDRLHHRGLHRHAHADRAHRASTCAQCRDVGLHHGLPGARHVCADAVEHGLDAQHRLAAGRGTRRSGSRRRRAQPRRPAQGPRRADPGRRARPRSSIIPTSPRRASADPSWNRRPAPCSPASNSAWALPT